VTDPLATRDGCFCSRNGYALGGGLGRLLGPFIKPRIEKFE
jgi:hypothetical protein